MKSLLTLQEEIKKRFDEFLGTEEKTCSFLDSVVAESFRAGVEAAKEGKDICPPHNLVDFNYVEQWGASVPPPNKKCTKCLIEVRF